MTLVKLFGLSMLIIFHFPILWHIVRRYSHGNWPSVVDMAALSSIIYLDLGIFAELLDIPFNPASAIYVDPLFIPYRDISEIVMWLTIVIVSPYLIYLGGFITNPGNSTVSQAPYTRIPDTRINLFILVSIMITLPLSMFAIIQVLRNWGGSLDGLIDTRRFFFIILSNYPAAAITVYIRQQNFRERSRWWFILTLFILAIPLMIYVAKRNSLIILPLILFLFYRRHSLRLLAMLLTIMVIFVTLIRPFTKTALYENESNSTDPTELFIDTIYSDFYPLPLIISLNKLVGPTQNLTSYPFEGYVWAFSIFFPDSIATYKQSIRSSQFYSMHYVKGIPLDDVRHTMEGGLLSDIQINAGSWAMLPGIIIYGVVFGLLDRLSRTIPAMVVPTRMMAAIIYMYQLSAVFLMFGAIFIFTLTLSLVFTNHNITLHKVNTSTG